jgi:hypothetical protein
MDNKRGKNACHSDIGVHRFETQIAAGQAEIEDGRQSAFRSALDAENAEGLAAVLALYCALVLRLEHPNWSVLAPLASEPIDHPTKL